MAQPLQQAATLLQEVVTLESDLIANETVGPVGPGGQRGARGPEGNVPPIFLGMQTQLNEIQASQRAILASQFVLSNSVARVINRGQQAHQPLTPLQDVNGISPPTFPLTTNDLYSMAMPELTVLMNFYGRPVPATVEDVRASFSLFIGR